MADVKMQISVQCFDCECDEELMAHCEEKMAAIEKMWDQAQSAEVRLGSFRGRFNTEITLVSDGLISRAQERGDNQRASFDAAVHKLQRQLADFKKKSMSRQRRHNNRDDATGTVLHPLVAPDIELAVSTNGLGSNASADLSSDGASSAPASGPAGTNAGIIDGLGDAVGDDESVVRVKKFALKPMSPEEASLQMDLLGHGFFVFRDDRSNEVSVVYRRHSGGYGLIEPVSD